MNRAYDEDLCCWVCIKCKKPFDSNCPDCGGDGYRGFDLIECDCCSCKLDYMI